MKVQVPIEVILQDPSGPSPVPTPTPTPVPGTDTPCNCDCSTVSVPNTGMQTAADVTGSVSVGLVIVASLIFAVAIGTLMLYLFHLYNHQKAVENKEEEKIKKHESKKAKAHKWSRGLFIASGATAVLAFAAFIGSFIFYSMLQPKGTSATSTPTPNESTYITTSDKITIVANRYDDVTIVEKVENSVFATTDLTGGYRLFMSMAGDDNKLYLDGDNTSEHYIAPTSGVDTALEPNTWGFNLNSGENYSSMILPDTPIVIGENISSVSGEKSDVYYGVKINSDLPLGTYKGEIEYEIKAIPGFPSTLTYMQDMTPEICNATPTPEVLNSDGTINDFVPKAVLKDTRDNKEYTIAKLADGKCWMTQNLDLGGSTEITLTPADSDVTSNFTLPVAQTKDDPVTGWEGDEAHIYDTPETVGRDGKTYTQEELGNLYNWYTATAGTGTYSTGSSEWENASGSICPKGWRLVDQIGVYAYPGRDMAEGGELKDFSELANVYDIIYDIQWASLYDREGLIYSRHNVDRLFSAPINLVRSGYYPSYGGGLYDVGNCGYVWSSKAFYSSSAGIYSFYSDSVSPWNNGGKDNGHSVRCIAK